MTALEALITEQLDVWSSAIVTQSTVGRGRRKKLNLYGIKKLRELILELAVRGQLVPQDSDDEPASVLLEKIAVERARLVKEKKIRKPKVLPPINDDEKLPLLPNTWKETRLGDVIEITSSKRIHKQDYVSSGIPFFRSKEIGELFRNEKISTDIYISIESYKKLSDLPGFPRKGDLMLTSVGSIGNSWVSDGRKFYYKDGNITKLGHSLFLSMIFIQTFINSPLFIKQVTGTVSGTAYNALTIIKLKNLVFPIPPLAEQHRIVAKVDELMSLCDTLEQAQESSINAHQTLVENLLNALTHAANQGDFDQAWTRIGAHFDTLFTTEHSIDQLKQTILQLAVMGKLVAQDPQDEPASVLLAKIAAEKVQLIKAKKLKKQKVLPPIGEDEKPFGLPEGWEWVRFGNLTNDIATGPFGSMVHKRDYISDGVPLINPSHMINSVIVEDSSISVSLEKATELSTYKLCTSDIVMARRGEMGRCALVTKREFGWLCGTGSFVLRFQFELSRSYILLLFKTKWIKSYLGGKSIGTTMTNLNHGILNKMPTPLPPLAEQKRIVAKVDQLLSLCDQLKSQIISGKTTQQHLADVLANQAVNT